jgi:hypothetical protein
MMKEDKFLPWKHVPDSSIMVVTDEPKFESTINEIIVDFRGELKRDWFHKHAYWCLPLVIANQYGYGIKSLSTFEVEWNGGDNPEDLTITFLDDTKTKNQHVNSWFGMGVLTIQNRFVLQTPKGINLMTMNPQNYYTDGLTNLNGVIETDNLKRDFTFNLRVTRPNFKIRVNKGDIISGFIPIPRYFVDGFNIVSGREVADEEYIKHIEQAGKDFTAERTGPDLEKPGTNGRRYFNGEDVYGCPYLDHQKRIEKPSKEETKKNKKRFGSLNIISYIREIIKK